MGTPDDGTATIEGEQSIVGAEAGSLAFFVRVEFCQGFLLERRCACRYVAVASISASL
jgi:hypothetical protein